MKKAVKKESKAKMHEAHEGKEFNKSEKHRHAESVGMKKSLKKK